MGQIMAVEEPSKLTWADFVDAYPDKLGRPAPPYEPVSAEHISVVTASTLKMPETPSLSPKGLGEEWERRPVAERLEEAARRDAVSVALAQPHRRGGDAPWLGEPLFQFVSSYGLAFGLYRAGEEYDQILMRAKVARGFKVAGNIPPVDTGSLTPAQIEAMRQSAIIREEKISGILRAIMPRLPRVLEKLCFDRLAASPYDHDIIRHGLTILAIEFEFLDRGINAHKPI